MKLIAYLEKSGAELKRLVDEFERGQTAIPYYLIEAQSNAAIINHVAKSK